MAFILALNTLPGAHAAQNLNYIAYPFPDNSPTRKGGSSGGTYGRGTGQMVNLLAAVHGRWVRHELSLRVPEVGQNYDGPVGDGNISDSNGIRAEIFLSRIFAPSGLPNQTVWIDNICITSCPGALALAHGASNVPMISAGFGADAFTNGANAGPGAFFTGASGFGSDVAIPTALTRGQVVYGSFSQGGTGSAQPAAAVSASTFWGTAANAGNAGMLDLAKAGFVRLGAQAGKTFDAAVIAAGGLDVALNFPSLPDGNRGLVLGPAPASVTGNAFTTNVTAGIPALVNGDPATEGYNGDARVSTMGLDMRLASDAVTPGLHVADVTFAGGSGGNPNGENGNLNPNQILGNVSGVFGLRFFVRSNAANASHNPNLEVFLTNADFVCGIHASRGPSGLPTGSDLNAPAGVWVDDFVSGSVITFNSYRRYYDILLNNQAGGLAGITGEVPAGILTDMAANNPGAQLAQVSIFKANPIGRTAGIRDIINADNFNGYNGIFAAVDPADVADTNPLPGRYGTACVAVDEVNVYGVRDSSRFYDEDLQRSDLLP
ncbi:MAG: hypothetical protein HUU16_16620 [Candidatus Omnitrophica bacterium]|nr:hypothetical protein [Candidatus Omnitrophota bacterium]